VFLADDGHGVVAVDVMNPSSPAELGSTSTAPADALIEANDRLWLSAGASGIFALNLVDPLSPAVEGVLDTPGTAEEIAVSGTLAVVADGGSGIHVVDVTDPSTMMIRSTVDAVFAASATLTGTTACFADGDTLKVVDVADPDAASLVGSLVLPALAFDVEARGSLAFVADFTSGVQVIDVSTPASPLLVTTIDTPDYSTAVSLADDGGPFLYVGDAQYVLVVDIADPSAPVIRGAVESADQIWALEAVGDGGPRTIVYVANAVAGVQVVDVSDPDAPILVGSMVAGNVQGVARVGSLVYAATSANGVRVLPAQCAAATHSPAITPQPSRDALAISVFPNPFRRSTAIRLASPGSGPVRLSIHDVGGRVVRQLVASGAGDGERTVAWDGADGRGRPVAPGVYFVHVSTPHGLASRPVVRLR
jgi:hypothetical protein